MVKSFSICLVEVGRNDVVIPEFVITSEVEFEGEPEPAQVVDAGVEEGAKPRVIMRAPKTGKVTVRVNPWAELSYGGKNLGLTPLAPIEVPAGTATFVLRNEQLGVTRKVSVKVSPGSSVVLKADLFTEVSPV